jgi:hypothetical protein
MMKKENDQSRKIFSLQLNLVSEARHGRAWLVLGGRQIFKRDCSETNS